MKRLTDHRRVFLLTLQSLPCCSAARAMPLRHPVRLPAPRLHYQRLINIQCQHILGRADSDRVIADLLDIAGGRADERRHSV